MSLRSIIAIPALLIYPLVPFFLLGIFSIYWVGATLYLFSAGEVKPTLLCCGFKFHHRKHIVWAILYHFLSLYWVTQFILASTLTTAAGAVASYYWAKGETAVSFWSYFWISLSSRKIPVSSHSDRVHIGLYFLFWQVWNGGEGSSWKGMGWLPVFSTGRHVMKFSVGSMALGSLVVPPVEFAQIFLRTLRTKLKSSQMTMPNGSVISTHGRYGICCLGCLDWTLARINRNAFIVVW